MAPDPQPSRRERQKRRRDDAIYRSALELFRREGFAATTMQTIADAAGVSRGTVFNYYPYKEAILVRYFAEELDALRADPPERGAGLEGLYAVFDRLAEFVERNRELVPPLSYELLNPDPERSRAAYAQLPLADLVRGYLDDGRAAGEVRTDLSVARLARTVANCYFLTALHWAAYRPERAVREEMRTALDLVLRGVVARGATPAAGAPERTEPRERGDAAPAR